MKIQLVQLYGWTLADIDQTDIQSLLPFIGRLSKNGAKGNKKYASSSKKGPTVYCDDPQASWL